MNRELALKVADSVLYEGYMLYPYRASALKNRQRWSFGILYPPDYEEVRRSSERDGMHSECLLKLKGDCKLHIQLRFLQLISQKKGFSATEGTPEELQTDEQSLPRSVELELNLRPELHHGSQFSFPARATTCSSLQPEIVSRMQRIAGTLMVDTAIVAENLLKLVIDVRNEAPPQSGGVDRDSALLRALLSAHLILSATNGEFVSLLDPPADLRVHAAACSNVGNFPVLLGCEGEHDMMLCSPIILYDYPQIAPESAGDFCDATEMDEMLTLRLMTLAQEEKNEIRFAGDYARALLERTERTARAQLMKTHGVIRSLRVVRENEKTDQTGE